MINYKTTKHAVINTGPEMTEQEHKESCDINVMIKNAHRGQMINGGGSLTYGYDDTTMDGVQFRINKEKIERELAEIAKTTPLSEEELGLVPDSVKKKFKFQTRAKENNDLNDKNKQHDEIEIPDNTVQKKDNTLPKDALHHNPTSKGSKP